MTEPIGTHSVEHSVPISRPSAQVFAYLVDARNQPAWCSGVSICRQTHLSRPAPSARYEVRRRVRASASLELVVATPHRRASWVRRERKLIVEIDCHVDRLADGSVVSYRETFGATGKARLYLRLLLRRYQVPHELWRLKRILENTEA
jgi:hypothetical protein